jgi:hypothetical protein
MKRRAPRLALAAAIGLIALLLLSQTAAGDSGGTGPLTHQFPLGTQTLSRSTTAAGGGSTTTSPGASATTPPRPATAAPATPKPAASATPKPAASAPHKPPAPATHKRTGTGIPTRAVLALIVALIAVAFLTLAVIRSSRRRVPRGRREISPTLERLLRPLFRYDPQRYALVLRGIGRRFGPVFHRRPPDHVRRRPGWIMRSGGPRARWSYEPEPEDEIERSPPPLPIRAQSTVTRARPAPGPAAKPHTPREQ